MNGDISYTAFKAVYDEGKPQVLVRPFIADMITPVAAMAKLTQNQPYSFMFESVEDGSRRGRYSFLGFAPDLIWCFQNGQVRINRNVQDNGEEDYRLCEIAAKAGPFASLAALHKESMMDVPDSIPHMVAGIYGYMGYDMVRYAEVLPDSNPDVIAVPQALFSRPSLVMVFDHINDRARLCASVYPSPKQSARAAYEIALERISNALHALEGPLPQYQKSVVSLSRGACEPQVQMQAQDYEAMVRRAQDYIKAGDIFQVVLAQRFVMPFDLPAFELYRCLRRINPSPYMFLLNFEDFAITGASPELLVRLDKDEVTIRPIAGTRKRGATTTEDVALAADLLADPKERAEHLMLLDLGRNDVGRVCEIGSVSVAPEQRETIEYYSHVMHIVSEVKGKIQPGKSALDALIAGFPAGTVSGAPKIRAMEIIDELEPEKRSFYAGCIAYFSANGNMDNCIALRTALIKEGALHVTAGAGVVADSVPGAEHQECINKSMAIIRAAQDALTRNQECTS